MPPKSAKQKACAANAAKWVKFQLAIIIITTIDNTSAGYIQVQVIMSTVLLLPLTLSLSWMKNLLQL